MNQPSQLQFGNYAVGRMLTAREVDYPDSDEHLIGILRSFNYEAVLITLARVNLLLQRTNDLINCERILRQNFCSRFLRGIIERRGLAGDMIFNRESSLHLLSKCATVSDRNSSRVPDTTVDAMHELLRCYLIVNGYDDMEPFDSKTNSMEEELKEFLAASIPTIEYAINSSPRRHIKHTLVQSKEFLVRLQTKASTFDVNDAFVQATGLTVQDYQNLVFSVYAVVRSFSQEEILNGKKFYFGTKTSETLKPLYDKFLQHTCISIDELTHRAETMSSLPREFRLWRKYPLVRLSENRLMCIDIGFLVDKLETGVFWIIRDQLEKEQIGTGEQLIGLRGQVFEDYAASIIERGINAQAPPWAESVFIRPRYVSRQREECTDIAICGNDILILVECKAPLLSAEAKFSRDPSAFYNGIKPSVIKGIEQLRDSIQNLGHTDKKKRRQFDGINISKIKKIYPVLVLPDRLFSFPGMNTFLNAEFQRLVRYNVLKKHLHDLCLTVLTITNLEDLEPYLCDKPFHAHLETWLQEFEKDEFFSFSQYLWSLRQNEARENSHVDNEFEQIISNMGEYFSSHNLN